MTDDPTPRPVSYPDPASPDAEEAWRLTDAMLAGTLDAAGEQRLMRLVVEQPAIARLYLRAVHEWCIIPVHRGLVDSPETLLGAMTDDRTHDDTLAETMIVPAMLETGAADLAAADTEIFKPAVIDPFRRPSPRVANRFWTPLRLWTWSGSAAAVLALAGAAIWSLRPTMTPVAIVVPPAVRPSTTDVPSNPPAVVSGLAGAVFAGGAPIQPGEALDKGQVIRLTAGAVELTFERGAVVVVDAPATIRLVNGDRLALDAGSLAAHVPPGAVGFRVDAPGLSAVDLGTDFGVRTAAKGGDSEAVVFKGAINAVPAGTATTVATEMAGMRVVAGQAVAHGAGDGAPPHAVAYAPGGFVRSLEALRLPIPIRGTGTQVPDGAADPNWHWVADPAGAFPAPRALFAIALPKDGYLLPAPDVRWLTNAPRKTFLGAGAFTVRTTVTLPDFAPGTLAMAANWASDDWSVDVVVNGTSTASVNGPLIGKASRMRPVHWSLDGAPWHKGDNQVDVVIWNQTSAKAPLSFMGFALSWAATYSPIVHRPAVSAAAALPSASPQGTGVDGPPKDGIELAAGRRPAGG